MTTRRPDPLRVLVVPDKYHPDECAGGAIYTDMCRGLVERGMDVTVRCPYPFYPEWIDKSGRNGWRVERRVEGGVKVERYGFLIPSDPRSARQRMLLDATFFASLSRSLLDGRFDAAIALCPHSGGVAFAALHKLIHGTPLLLSVMDLPADAARATGIARGGWLPPLLLAVQKALFNRAEVWRSISPAMVERLGELRGRDQPILFIPDWLHPSLAAEIHRLPPKVGRLPGRPPRLLYSGNIGTKQGLLDFCEGLRGCAAPFDFRIRGGGGIAAEVRDWVASVGDARFSFGPLVDERGFARSLHEADFYVVTERSGAGSSYYPSKTIPAMASGTPILAVSDPESPLGREVRHQGLGPWASWEHLGEVGAMLESLESRPGSFVAWQRNGVRRGQFFERERCLDLLENTLDDMARDRTLARTRALVASEPSAIATAVS